MKHYGRELQQTADGTYTLFIPEIDEHYHSVNGAITEANHVYIKEALLHRLYKGASLIIKDNDTVKVLEVGFGTGLNAFLTLVNAVEKNIKTEYVTLELYPLSQDIISKINYGAFVDERYAGLYMKLHESEWDTPVEIDKNFILTKKNIDLKDFISDPVFDVVYFDAFAPDKQPDMWNDEIYKKIVGAMAENGVMTTYCAKGVVRRGFRDAGLTMERIPGPPGKREMIRGSKI